LQQDAAKSGLPHGHEQFKDVPSIPAAGIFATSDARFLKLLARASSQRTAVPGEVFITAGDHNDTAFILLHGDVEVVTDNTCGREAFSRVLSAPNIFGEDCVLKTRQASLATVRAHTACHIRTLSGQSFKVLLRRFPEERHFFHLHAKSRLEELGVNFSDRGNGVNASTGRSPLARNSTEALTASLGIASEAISPASPKQRRCPSSVASSSDDSIGNGGHDDLTDIIQSAIYSAGVSCGNGGRRGTPTDEPAPRSEVNARDVALSNARVSAALLRERLLGKEEFGPPPSLGCKVLATTLPILDFEPPSQFNRGSRPRRSKAGEQASNASQQQVGSPQAMSGSAGGFTPKGGGAFGLEIGAGGGLSSQAGSGHKARALQPSLAAAYSARLARANCSRPATGAGSSLADWSAATSERSAVMSERSVQLCLSTQASTHTLFSTGQKSEEHHQTSNVDWRRGHRHHNKSSKGKAVNSVGGNSAPSRSPDTQPLSRSTLNASPEEFADPQPPPPQLSQPPPPPEGGHNERRLVPFTLKGDEFFCQGNSPRPAYTPSGRSVQSVQTRSTSRDSSTCSLLQAPLSPAANLHPPPPPPPPPGSGQAGVPGLQAEFGRSRPATLELDYQAEPAEGSPRNSPRGSPQAAWTFSPRSRSSSVDDGDDRTEDEGRARGVLLMGGLAAQNRSHTSSAQSLSVQSVNEGVLTPSAPSSPRLRGAPQVRLRGSRPITPSGGDGTSLPLLREGWQVSLCQNVMMWCPSALPSKDTFTQKKVPRPVSPEGSKARSPRPDPSTLDMSLLLDRPSTTCTNSQEAAAFEPISPKGSPLRRRPRRVAQSSEVLGGVQDPGAQVAQAACAAALPRAATREHSPAAESAAAIEEDCISPTAVAARWAAEIPKLRIAPPTGPPPGAPQPPAPAPSGLPNANDAFDQLLLHRLSTLTPRISPTPSARGQSDSSPRTNMHSPAALVASPRPLPSAAVADADSKIH